MRKTLVTAFTIGSLALSSVSVAAAIASTDANNSTSSLLQHQLSRKERHTARITELAGMLGVTVDQLKEELKAGKKPLQIAEDHGVTKDQLKQKMDARRVSMMNKIKDRLTEDVKSGKITQDQMDARLKAFEAHKGKHQGWHRRHFGYGKHKVLSNKKWFAAPVNKVQ